MNSKQRQFVFFQHQRLFRALYRPTSGWGKKDNKPEMLWFHQRVAVVVLASHCYVHSPDLPLAGCEGRASLKQPITPQMKRNNTTNSQWSWSDCVLSWSSLSISCRISILNRENAHHKEQKMPPARIRLFPLSFCQGNTMLCRNVKKKDKVPFLASSTDNFCSRTACSSSCNLV